MGKHLQFLEKKGSLDILYKLKESPKSFNELEESIGMSPNTILARLREAQKFGMVEEKLIREKEGRSKIKYALTKKGYDVSDNFRNIANKYMHLREEIQELEGEKRSKEKEMKEILSSFQGSKAIVNMTGVKIKTRGNVTLKTQSK